MHFGGNGSHVALEGGVPISFSEATTESGKRGQCDKTYCYLPSGSVLPLPLTGTFPIPVPLTQQASISTRINSYTSTRGSTFVFRYYSLEATLLCRAGYTLSFAMHF